MKRSRKSQSAIDRNADLSAGVGELLENETISSVELHPRETATDEELNSRFAKGEVRIVTESARYSLAGILSMLKETQYPVGFHPQHA